ncbi:CopG family transcriptional regulator [Bacillus mycoides]|uniref:CopG family transcriptional regulator n=1 Tax=Bacillus TaxID=1386 RepID=UPI001914246C|nr:MULTISPECIES: CopG family transcriptional regulator [Bacillus]MBK5349139.1 CopG family transcriptional regulator [Bacillus sp. TH45]MBK5357825.1 CopG family transcriptional regulator [Bacillus sp. TH44]MBK5363958.1 CopG family transcriptional regulator [Bacillus sp. TH50]WJE75871.1 CopG family transcriptional regulator [Bacillus mycoides]
MKIEEVLASLKESNAKEVGKEIGMCDKRLLKRLKNAGYKHSKKGGIGWYFTGQGEAPLKADIREFIAVADDTKVEAMDNVFTKKDIREIRKMLSEWGTTKDAVNTLMQQEEKISAQKNTNPMYSLYMRIGESGTQEKVSRTVNLSKEACTKLGTVEEKRRLSRDEIVEIALFEFFEKYKV